jgi:hypothetical protein
MSAATIVCSKGGRLPRLDGGHRCTSRAGRLKGLLARCAGVHVDFHADRHFDDLRSFPGHSFLPVSSNQALSRPELNLEIYRMLRGENGQAWAEFNRPLEKLMEYIPPNIEILKLLTA